MTKPDHVVRREARFGFSIGPGSTKPFDGSIDATTPSRLAQISDFYELGGMRFAGGDRAQSVVWRRGAFANATAAAR